MLGKILYWLAVVAVSVAIVVGVLLLLESRDDSSVGSDAGSRAAALSSS